jgi:hypothetical protein
MALSSSVGLVFGCRPVYFDLLGISLAKMANRSVSPSQMNVYHKKLLREVALMNAYARISARLLDASRKCNIYKEELIKIAFHPNRVIRHLERYNYDLNQDEYFD